MSGKLEITHRYEVYVYDTEIIQSEYDDPLKAVLFHFPEKLTPEHVLVTAGQLAGIAQFFSMALGEEAKFFQLERGRFEIEKCGRFLLFVGDMTVQTLHEDDSAKRIKDEILEAIGFFFGSLDEWSSSCEIAAMVSQDKKKECYFNKSLESFLTSFFLQQQHFPDRPLLKPDLSPAAAHSLLNKCKRVAKECHDHQETRGCLIRVNGKVALSTFSPAVTGLLRLAESTSQSSLLAKATDFRLPIGAVLISLATRPNWHRPLNQENPLLLDDYLTGAESDYSSSSSSSRSSSTAESILQQENVGFPLHRSRKSAASRNVELSSRERLRRRGEEDLVRLLRKSLFRLSSSREVRQEDSEEPHSALYIQKFGVVEMCVGLTCSGRMSKALLRDYWNISLSTLPKINLFLRQML